MLRGLQSTGLRASSVDRSLLWLLEGRIEREDEEEKEGGKDSTRLNNRAWSSISIHIDWPTITRPLRLCEKQVANSVTEDGLKTEVEPGSTAGATIGWSRGPCRFCKRSHLSHSSSQSFSTDLLLQDAANAALMRLFSPRSNPYRHGPSITITLRVRIRRPQLSPTLE